MNARPPLRPEVLGGVYWPAGRTKVAALSRPPGGWWSALRFADRELKYVSAASNCLPPLSPQKVLRKGDLVTERDLDRGLKVAVDRAYARWWAKYGRL